MIELAKAKDTIEIDRIVKANIYTVWTECEVSQELWNYYKTELTGSKPLG
ncbi:hypothetical protein [Sphingobacterium mizutaii]|nr:hypothetical protein [Sphingobacterium mizutaii]